MAHILVVDDDPAITTMLRRGLASTQVRPEQLVTAVEQAGFRAETPVPR